MGLGKVPTRQLFQDKVDEEGIRWFMCISNKVACYVIGLVLMVVSIICLGFSTKLLIWGKEIPTNTILGSFGIVIAVSLSLGAIVMFSGLAKRDPNKFVPMLIALFVTTVLLIVIIVVTFQSQYYEPVTKIIVTIVNSVLVVVLIYFFVVVKFYRNKLETFSRNRVRPIDNQREP